MKDQLGSKNRIFFQTVIGPILSNFVPNKKPLDQFTHQYFLQKHTFWIKMGQNRSKKCLKKNEFFGRRGSGQKKEWTKSGLKLHQIFLLGSGSKKDKFLQIWENFLFKSLRKILRVKILITQFARRRDFSGMQEPQVASFGGLWRKEK